MLRVYEVTKYFNKLTQDQVRAVFNACLLAESLNIEDGGKLVAEKLSSHGLHVHCGNNHLAIARENNPGAMCYAKIADIGEGSRLCEAMKREVIRYC